MAIQPAPTPTKRRHGGDSRGSAASRRARTAWLLGRTRDRRLGWAPFGGNGQTVPCFYCGTALKEGTLTQDRIVPGAMGGAYRRENLVPACLPCNQARGDDPTWTHECEEDHR